MLKTKQNKKVAHTKNKITQRKQGFRFATLGGCTKKEKMPGRFTDLVQMMPPQAIMDQNHYDNTIELIDHLMTSGKLTQGQALYLETLVQLIEAYESEHHAIDTSDITGIQSLQHLLNENDMNASDLARLLGIHVSMGSKILNGDRSLTIEHLQKLAIYFNVRPDLFIDK